MRVLRLVGITVTSGILAAGVGMASQSLAWEQDALPASQSAGVAASAQGAGSTTVLVPQSQLVYETVQSVECVQVPVTHMQTLYRQEVRTETVPVTRMIPEQVNETRTITTMVCKPQ